MTNPDYKCRYAVLVAETLQGGVGGAVAWNARLAVANGFKVIVFAPAAHGDVPLPNGVRHHVAPFPRSISHLFSVVRCYVLLQRLLSTLPRRRMVMHAHGLRALALVLPRRRIVVTYHGARGLPGSAKASEVGRRAMFYLVPRIVQCAFSVVPLSGWQTIWLSSPNTLAGLAPDRAASGRVELLWIGRVSPPKQIRTLLCLVEELGALGVDATATVVGGGSDLPQAKREAHDRSLPVTFVGPVADVHPFLVRDAVFCLFSNSEGRPFSVEEALSYGLPVIVSDLPGIRLMVRKQDLIVRTVEEAVTAAMQLRTPEARREIGATLRSDYWALRKSHMDAADAVMSSYESLLSRSARGQRGGIQG